LVHIYYIDRHSKATGVTRILEGDGAAEGGWLSDKPFAGELPNMPPERRDPVELACANATL
jgi:hypothetical protein